MESVLVPQVRRNVPESVPTSSPTPTTVEHVGKNAPVVRGASTAGVLPSVAVTQRKHVAALDSVHSVWMLAQATVIVVAATSHAKMGTPVKVVDASVPLTGSSVVAAALTHKLIEGTVAHAARFVPAPCIVCRGSVGLVHPKKRSVVIAHVPICKRIPIIVAPAIGDAQLDEAV